MNSKSKRYSPTEKAAICELALKIGKTAAAKEFNVSINTVIKWLKPKKVEKVFTRSEEALFNLAIKNEHVKLQIIEIVKQRSELKMQVIDSYIETLQPN
jgi:transposase-like protein